ncbi:FtsQ-type POTRA domain-containing protein [Actinomadura sp. KC345]|uniref:cell division protein FtsQ/DivIB n=1 Tax=Actinomadura sp. KC345 TaxID=2530371 RepID=UPI001046DE54|nr:FtsQ-type POTRA domain-containing protein [Actinomadura sp. KC345]TDC55139.1 FtsQ-type POTRA domain-containing protein [Actinomadura sp. KC345]
MNEARTGRRAVRDGVPGPDEEQAPDEAPGEERGRPGRWKVVFVTLLVLGALAAVTWVLLGSRLLVVRHVEVTGTDLAPRDRVVAAAGISLGKPMARLATGGIRARVEELREVESAEIERHWPGTVRIVVRERVPAAVFERDGRYHSIDRHGVVVADGESRPAGLPTLAAASPGPSDKATLAALTVLSDLPERLKRQVREVTATGPEAVTLLMASGQTVEWGGAERAEEKIRLLEALWRTAAGRAVATADVSSPEVLKTK